MFSICSRFRRCFAIRFGISYLHLRHGSHKIQHFIFLITKHFCAVYDYLVRHSATLGFPFALCNYDESGIVLQNFFGKSRILE